MITYPYKLIPPIPAEYVWEVCKPPIELEVTTPRMVYCRGQIHQCGKDAQALWVYDAATYCGRVISPPVLPQL